MHREGRGDLATLALESGYCPEGLGITPGSCVAQLSERPAELIVSITKPVALFSQGTWRGLLELRQRVLLALEILSPLC